MLSIIVGWIKGTPQPDSFQSLQSDLLNLILEFLSLNERFAFASCSTTLAQRVRNCHWPVPLFISNIFSPFVAQAILNKTNSSHLRWEHPIYNQDTPLAGPLTTDALQIQSLELVNGLPPITTLTSLLPQFQNLSELKFSVQYANLLSSAAHEIIPALQTLKHLKKLTLPSSYLWNSGGGGLVHPLPDPASVDALFKLLAENPIEELSTYIPQVEYMDNVWSIAPTLKHLTTLHLSLQNEAAYLQLINRVGAFSHLKSLLLDVVEKEDFVLDRQELNSSPTSILRLINLQELALPHFRGIPDLVDFHVLLLQVCTKVSTLRIPFAKASALVPHLVKLPLKSLNLFLEGASETELEGLLLALRDSELRDLTLHFITGEQFTHSASDALSKILTLRSLKVTAQNVFHFPVNRVLPLHHDYVEHVDLYETFVHGLDLQLPKCHDLMLPLPSAFSDYENLASIFYPSVKNYVIFREYNRFKSLVELTPKKNMHHVILEGLGEDPKSISPHGLMDVRILKDGHLFFGLDSTARNSGVPRPPTKVLKELSHGDILDIQPRNRGC